MKKSLLIIGAFLALCLVPRADAQVTASGQFTTDALNAQAPIVTLPSAAVAISATVSTSGTLACSGAYPTIQYIDTRNASNLVLATVTLSNAASFPVTLNFTPLALGDIIFGEITTAGVGCTNDVPITVTLVYLPAAGICYSNPSACVTVQGYLAGANGLASKNYTLDFSLSQLAFLGGMASSTSGGGGGGNCFGEGVTPGDLCYYNGSNWVILSGNENTLKFLSETTGVPSWQDGGGGGCAISGLPRYAVLSVNPSNVCYADDNFSYTPTGGTYPNFVEIGSSNGGNFQVDYSETWQFFTNGSFFEEYTQHGDTSLVTVQNSGSGAGSSDAIAFSATGSNYNNGNQAQGGYFEGISDNNGTTNLIGVQGATDNCTNTSQYSIDVLAQDPPCLDPNPSVLKAMFLNFVVPSDQGSPSTGYYNNWAGVFQGKIWTQDIQIQPEVSDNTGLFGNYGYNNADMGYGQMLQVACDSTQRGRIHYVNSTSGVQDIAEICQQTSGGYAWVSFAGGGSGGDTITSPHSTIAIGGSPSATTLDVAGAAGKIMGGATPALTYTPILGVDNSSAGSLQTANGSANAHTIWGSAATTSNTILGFATAPTNGHIVTCAVSTTICTLTDGGVLAADILTYHTPATGIARTTSSSQAVVSTELSGDATTSGSNAVTVVKVNGAAVPASAPVIGTNSSHQIVAGTTIHTINFLAGTPGGSALSAGVLGYFTVPIACTITGWNIAADAGTDTVKTLKVASGTAIPTLGSNSISTSGVSLASGTVIQSTTLTDFTTTTVTANDIVGADLITTSSTGYIDFQLVLSCAQ